MRLHEVAHEIEHLLGTAVDAETGEISEETAAALDALELDRSRLALDLATYAKGLELEAGALDVRAKELTQRSKRMERKAESLLKYVERFVAPGQKLRDDRVAISWRKSTRVEVLDETLIPDVYQREIPRRFEPDKRALKEALKAGEEIAGARLVTEQQMRVE